MSVSKTDICNLALRQVGQYRIEDYTENSVDAELCRDLYEFMRKETLRVHPWNFATTTVELSQTSNTPDDYDYEYALPADELRTLKILAELDTSDPIKFELRAGKTLVCDEDEVEILYIKDVDDPDQFDSQFITAFAYRLAAELALPLSGSMEKKNMLLNQYNAFVISAQGTDAGEGRRDDTARIGQEFIEART